MRHVESVKNSVGYLIRFQLHFMKGESFRVSITIVVPYFRQKGEPSALYVAPNFLIFPFTPLPVVSTSEPCTFYYN